MPSVTQASFFRSLALGTAIVSGACTGIIGGDAPPATLLEDAQALDAPIRRLTAAEYRQTVLDLFGVEVDAALVLPPDPRMPFDNGVDQQLASEALVEALELLASDIAEEIAERPELRSSLVGCTPEQAGDEECLRRFITEAGRRVLRRPLSEREIAEYLAFSAHAVEANDFYVAVDSILRAWLQHPEFVYRVDLGEPVEGHPGLYVLTDWEIASRLSYLIWGSTPDEPLLERAARGELSTPSQRAEVAATMLSDPRARARIRRFHAMWLGYEEIATGSELAPKMLTESHALVERVVFDQQLPYRALFELEETYVDDELAEHYGLVPPGSQTPTWVSLEGTERRGILSHGSFLAQGASGQDTSPTFRGYNIRERLFCQTIPDPPADVAADAPPAASPDAPCKWDRYEAHRADPSCAGCHDMMDPVGFGLEAYDLTGRFRTHDEGLPQCLIEGTGAIAGVGEFEGPAGLAELLVDEEILQSCLSVQLTRFATGHMDLDASHQALAEQILSELDPVDFRFDDLLLALVSSPQFGHRRESQENTP